MRVQLEGYSQYNIPIHLSEVTVLSSNQFEDWREKVDWINKFEKANQSGEGLSLPSTKAGEKYQAEYLKDFYTLAFSHPAIDAIVYWSVSDHINLGEG